MKYAPLPSSPSSCSSMSISFLHWGAQNWTQHSKCVSPRLRRGNNHHLCPAGNTLPHVLQGAVRSSLLQRCIVGSCSIYCSLGTQNCCLPFWSILHQFDNEDIMRERVKSLAENKTNSSHCSPLINNDILP